MGSQTVCSGPLEINESPAPNSDYQGASDPYLLYGECSQSHFILSLSHTHTKSHTCVRVLKLVFPAEACENIHTHTRGLLSQALLNREEMNVSARFKRRSVKEPQGDEG